MLIVTTSPRHVGFGHFHQGAAISGWNKVTRGEHLHVHDWQNAMKFIMVMDFPRDDFFADVMDLRVDSLVHNSYYRILASIEKIHYVVTNRAHIERLRSCPRYWTNRLHHRGKELLVRL